MPENKRIYLGSCIRSARISCHLTIQELAEQCGLTANTIHNIETGKMNPSYLTLYALIKRLGISAEILFNPTLSDEDLKTQHIIGKLQACTPENSRILLNTLDYLIDQFLSRQQDSKQKDAE